MSDKKKITVRAAEGRKVFFPSSVGSAPGRRVLVIAGDETAEVDGEDRFVQKRLKLGDLVVVKQTRTRKPPADKKTESDEG